MKLLLSFLVSLILSTVGLSQSYSLEDILSSAMPTGLTISGNEKIAWVENKEGVRNIWLASAPNYLAEMITTYSEDNGMEVGQLVFSADESMLYYVLGGAPNGRGEYPNPSLKTGGVGRAIWQLDLASKQSLKLAKGSSPTLSPNGNTLIYINSGQIYSYDITNDETKAKHLIHTRGRASSLKWSPDGNKIAFQSNRRDHSFIGVFNVADSTLTYIDPTVDLDGSPVWSLNSKQIAFIRRPNESAILPFMSRRSGLPWSIRVANVESAKSEEIWRAKEGVGSVFRFISASNQIMWAANNEIVFPYEGEGWTHLYTVNADSRKVKLLTPGNFEVQFVDLAASGKSVVFSSNQDDIDRQHIWQVDLASGKLKKLTSGAGVEWSPRMNNVGDLFMLASGPTTPAHVEMMKSNSGKPARIHPESIPQNFPDAKTLVVPEQVVFSAADGMKIHGQLFLPKNMKKGGKHPALLFFHGGSRRQMLLGFHHSGYYHKAYALNQYLASQGYIVLSVNYRSGIGYGMEFREALNYGARGASEFLDVLGAGIYLQNRDDVDDSNIGLWGGSYGGFLTAMGLAKASDMFTAGVDLHGVHDWNIVIRNFAPTYDAGKNVAAAKLAFDSSPLAYVDTWRSPVLLIHGDDDRNVPFSETVHLVEALRRQGVEFEQLIFPDEVHGFLMHKSWLKAYNATVDFFNRKLK